MKTLAVALAITGQILFAPVPAAADTIYTYTGTNLHLVVSFPVNFDPTGVTGSFRQFGDAGFGLSYGNPGSSFISPVNTIHFTDGQIDGWYLISDVIPGFIATTTSEEVLFYSYTPNCGQNSYYCYIFNDVRVPAGTWSGGPAAVPAPIIGAGLAPLLLTALFFLRRRRL